MSNRRALVSLLPLALLALLSGVTPAISGLAVTLSREGLGILRSLGGDRAFIYTLRISSLWAVANTAGVLVLAFPVAVVMYLRPRIFPAAVTLLAIPWIVPVFISGPVWRLFFHGIGGDSLWSLLTGLGVNMLTQPVRSFAVVLGASIWHGLPPAVFIFYASLKKVSRASLEAAEIDGAGHWETVRYLLLPQAREFVFIVALVSVVEGLGEFTLPFVMTAGGPPLVAGITESYVVGATTTVELFLYDLFRFSGDLRVPVVYSTATLVAFAVMAALWSGAKRRGTGRHALLALLSIAAIVVFDRSLPGLLMAAVLLVAWGTRRTHSRALAGGAALYVGYCVVALVSRGFLDAFQPAIFALLPFIIDGARRLVKSTTRRKGKARGRWVRNGIRASRWPGTVAWGLLQFTAISLVTGSVLVFAYLLLWVSFSGVDSALVDSFFPPYFGLANFGNLLGDAAFYRAMVNTLVLAVLTSVASVLVTFPAAAFTALHTNRGRSVFLGLQFLRLTGGIHSLIPLFGVFLFLRLINTYVPLVLLYAFAAAPLGFIIFHGFIRDLPRSLYDEARISGASEFRYLRQILLPLCGPPAMTAGLLAFLAAWNGFLIPLVFLTNQERFPLSIYLHNAVGSIASGTPAWGLFAAGSVLNIIVLSILFVTSRKPFLSTSAAQVE